MEASALQAPVTLGRISVSVHLLRLRSDEQLVEVFRSGNDDAFRVIHDRYRTRLFAYVRQMLAGSRQDAEDVLQDVFIRAYGALRENGRPISLRAWLYRVAHNRCIDQLRRPVPAPAEMFEVSRQPLRDPLVESECREDLRRLVADVRRLPNQQRSALLMREMQGMSYVELAAALAVSVPAVKSLLVRARMGLVEAAEARDTACLDIREDLVSSSGRGVRMSGRVRRHVRECSGCHAYRVQLRGVSRGLDSLTPSGSTMGLLAKLGLGGSASAATGGAAGGGGVALLGGGSLAAATATKVASLVCCAAVLTGGGLSVPASLRLGHHARGAGPSDRTRAEIPKTSTVALAALTPQLVHVANWVSESVGRVRVDQGGPTPVIDLDAQTGTGTGHGGFKAKSPTSTAGKGSGATVSSPQSSAVSPTLAQSIAAAATGSTGLLHPGGPADNRADLSATNPGSSPSSTGAPAPAGSQSANPGASGGNGNPNGAPGSSGSGSASSGSSSSMGAASTPSGHTP